MLDQATYIPRYKALYQTTIKPALTEEFGYKNQMMLPRLDKGGLFTAHNVVNKRSEMGEFLDAIQRNPSLWTAIVAPSGEGISLSLKR